MGKIIYFILVTSLYSMAWGAELTLDQRDTPFLSGTPIKLKYSGGSKLDADAWVGIFRSGFRSNNEYLSFQYLKGDSGTLVFSAPKEPGVFEFALYDKGYKGKALARVEFTVNEVASSAVMIAIDKSSYQPASRISVDLTLKNSLSEQAWLGVFPAQIPHGSTSGYLSYEYAGNNTHRLLNIMAPEKPGRYEFRFFDDSYGNEIKHIPFEVTAFDNRDISVKTDKKSYVPQEMIKVHFKANSDFPENAWIGLFEGQDIDSVSGVARYLDFRYLKKMVEADLTFMAPGSKGDYQFRMISSEHGLVVATVDFSVNRSVDSSYLKEQIDKTGKIVLYGIYFDLDKAEIKPASLPTLQALGDLLKRTGDLSISIEGHTDDQGESGYNRQLSELRAKAVKQYLIDNFTIADKRLRAVGFGEEKPVNDNHTETGRALNRRVEIVKLSGQDKAGIQSYLSGIYAVDMAVFKTDLEKSIATTMPKFRFHQDHRVEIIVNGSAAAEGSYTIDQADSSHLTLKSRGKIKKARLSEDRSRFHFMEGDTTDYVKQ